VRWVFLHSPLTGPSVWRPAATEAARRGIEVCVPELPELSRLRAPYYPALGVQAAGQMAGEGPAALIVHSAAGGLAATVVAAAPGQVAQVVFVDAILPHPGRTWFSTAADAFAQGVRAKAEGGMVPAWDRWFPEGALGALIGDHTRRKAFVRELRPTPEAFLDEPAPDLPMPDEVGWAYLRLSKAYEDEAREARRLGWPTLRRDLHHLAPVTHATEVVSSLMNLIRG
jgi:pimeloyl-ACP methyl ester carboxylesterase